jgi:hypothetical protein
MTRLDANDDELPDYAWTFTFNSEGQLWIRPRGGDLPCDLALRLGSPTPHRLVCVELRIGAAPGEEPYEVTARMLRDIRLGNILRGIREIASGFPPYEALGAVISADGRTIGDFIADRAVTMQPRRGRKGLDPETLRLTAEAYLRAVEEGSTQPLAVTAQAVDVHPSTAWRRLQSAWKRFPELDPRKGAEP